jgi:alpha/beta superfamily hydrolase
MNPFFFDAGGRQLFAIYQDAGGAAGGRSSVLICGPWGQEAVRLHRLCRVLCDRLARQGVSSLRFDYFGTGDSSGADAEADVQGFAADIRHASDELRRRSGAERQVWLGIRLGACAAAMAANACATPPHSMVLLEPIADGGRYLGELKQASVGVVESSYTFPEAEARRVLSDPQGLEREGAGFTLGTSMLAQLKALGGLLPAAPGASRLHVLDRNDPAVTALIAGWGSRCDIQRASLSGPDFEWFDEEAGNTSLVPGHLLQTMEAAVLQCVK